MSRAADILLPGEPRAALEWTAAELGRRAPVYAGTLGLDGRPQLRPIRFLFARDGALYFLTAKSRRLYAELCKTPFVQICCPDSEAARFLRVSGKVCFTEDQALLREALRQYPGLPEEMGAEEKALIAFFLLGARAELTPGLAETPLAERALPDPQGLLIGITIKKKTELRDRISRILERREAEPPCLPGESALLYDGALFLFAEAAKALWPRMDIRPLERAACFETWDQREQYTKLAASLVGNAVIDKPEDLSHWLNPETLEALRASAEGGRASG